MSMFECEECGVKAHQWPDIYDFCVKCSRNLCDACMAKGCCGSVPAASGLDVISEEFLAGMAKAEGRDERE